MAWVQCLLLGQQCVSSTHRWVRWCLCCLSLPAWVAFQRLHFQREQSSSHQPPAGAAQGSHPVTYGAACEVLMPCQAQDLSSTCEDAALHFSSLAARCSSWMCCWILPAPRSTRSALSQPAPGAILVRGDYSSFRDRSELQELLGLATDLEVTKKLVLQAKGGLRRDMCTWFSLPLFASKGLALHEDDGQLDA